MCGELPTHKSAPLRIQETASAAALPERCKFVLADASAQFSVSSAKERLARLEINLCEGISIPYLTSSH